MTIILLFICVAPAESKAQSLAERFKGYILLQVDSKGEAWYVYPNNLKRYYLGRPDDAFQVMRQLGLGATHSYITNNTTFPLSVSGKILLDVQSHGEAYYIYPKDRLKYYLGRPTDAFSIMQQLSFGITTANLSLIPVGDLLSQSNGVSDNISNYEEKLVVVGKDTFAVKMVTIDLSAPGLEIITDTASDYDCNTDCPTKTLVDYVKAASGFTAINGSYFCASDYISCATTKNYFFYPVYNSRLGKMINADQLKWPTTGPILVFGTDNHPYFILSTQEFKDVATFESAYGTKIKAAISNKPALIHNGINIVSDQELDTKQRTVKSLRSGIGIKDNKAFLLVASNATVIDLGNIMESLGMDQAMNLDGGGSTALYYQGLYKAGPGRNLPNAIVFKKSQVK
jgi:hypothetical protein